MKNKVTKIWLYLLPIAFLTSMAAMEFFSWTFFLIFLFYLGDDLKTQGFKPVLKQLSLKIDWALWGYFLSVCLGVLLYVESQKIDIIGDVRWILLLYAYSYMLKFHLNESFESYLKTLAIVVCLVGLLSFVQFFWGIDLTRKRNILSNFGSFFRASGFFNHPLTFAYSIGMVGMVLGAFSIGHLRKPNISRSGILIVAASLFAGIGLIASLSRGAWGAGVVGVMVIFYQVNKMWAAGALVTIFLISGTLYKTNVTIQERFDSLTTIQKNESNRLRTVLWKANWEIFLDYPILGVGLSKNRDYLKEYYQRLGMVGETIVSHAHNNYLQILAGTGVMGFFFYLSFGIYFLKLAWNLWKTYTPHNFFYSYLSLGLFASQVVFHLGGLTQCNFTDGEVNHQLVFSWALLVAMSWQAKDEGRLL